MRKKAKLFINGYFQLITVLVLLSGICQCSENLDNDSESEQQDDFTSSHCYLEELNGTLNFAADSAGNKIPDFSYAGYKNSNSLLPVSGQQYKIIVTLTNPSGDETKRIQDAINEVSELSVNESGYRGAVELGEGTWNITGLVIDADGVILSGAGKDKTILQSTVTSSPQQVVRVGPTIPSSFPTELWDDGGEGARWNITSPVVNVGDMNFAVSEGHTLQVGDRIIIEHPCTDEWLSAIGGGAPEPKQWPVNSVPIRYYRYVTAVNGNKITVDAPIMYSLVKAYSQCSVYKYSVITRKFVGIENMTIDADLSTDNFNENHANSCVRTHRVENCWFRNIRTQNFGGCGFTIIESSRVTVADCEAIDPHSIITSSRRYNFQTRGSQLVLFKNCFAERGRHSFVGAGHGMDSGNVFLKCIAKNNYAATEDGHQRWVNGTLFDGCKFSQSGVPEDGNEFDPKMLWLGNHGDNSNGHGWSSCTGVAYKCATGSPGYAIIAKPPTGMNYEIECIGDFRSDHFTHGDYPGAIDIPTKGTLPESLFEAQLNQRH